MLTVKGTQSSTGFYPHPVPVCLGVWGFQAQNAWLLTPFILQLQGCKSRTEGIGYAQYRTVMWSFYCGLNKGKNYLPYTLNSGGKYLVLLPTTAVAPPEPCPGHKYPFSQALQPLPCQSCWHPECCRLRTGSQCKSEHICPQLTHAAPSCTTKRCSYRLPTPRRLF